MMHSNNDDPQKPDEVIELLKNFYAPNEGMMGFEDFYQSIEQKIEDSNPVNKVKKINQQVEETYVLREQRLENFISKLEQTQIQKKQILNKPKYPKALIAAGIIILAIALTCIASLENSSRHNYISIENDLVDWNTLGLSQKQKEELSKLDKKLQEIESEEKVFIDRTKNKLSEEMHKEKIDFSLIDKYQRDILDHEASLKRERLNIFLEKRFLLTETQSLELIKAINQKALQN